MPLVCEPEYLPRASNPPPTFTPQRRQSQQSGIAKSVIKSQATVEHQKHQLQEDMPVSSLGEDFANLRADLNRSLSQSNGHNRRDDGSMKPPPASAKQQQSSMSMAMSDTPATTAPNSPRIPPLRQNSGSSTPRVRPTTLDIPGLTKSKLSPDGRIASQDVGSKLVIVMVGLPARGKSYITKKLARYLNWLQHDCKIFNVGERRRVAAGGPNTLERRRSRQSYTLQPEQAHAQTSATGLLPGLINHRQSIDAPTLAAHIMLNGETALQPPGTPDRERKQRTDTSTGEDGKPSSQSLLDTSQLSSLVEMPDTAHMDQDASFFDPSNKQGALIREQCAMETLDELLDYILDGGGSVGILDATNSTLERRKVVMRKIRERAGAELNVLFLESRCVDENLLESNMRLKLSGPDYKDKDPVSALADFKKRVAIYEKAYVPLGDYEEKNNMPYIQMVDVGRKIISHQINGFLMAQANYYLLNFNLAPRQIWITRHGLSLDNISGKIGGDSDLSAEGDRYARALAKFMDYQRKEWHAKQLHISQHSHFPPQPGDTTPPNPHYQPNGDDVDIPQRAFCVWTSMLKRSIQTARYFDEEDYDTKQMRMLDELNSGVMEGLTYASIANAYPEEYRLRKTDKLHYRYPGPGGEGYLDIINRLRPVIVELERMTDHVLLVGHRSVARVLLAYFKGLKREEVADLDVPIGMLYCLEPKPYGVQFQAFRWDKDAEWFYEQPNFELKRAVDDML